MTQPVSLFSAALTSAFDGLAADLRQAVAPAGPRVLIVPGLPGSRIGRPPRDAIWLDPLALRAGRFPELAYDSPGVGQLGLFEELYLRMMLHLRLAGYRVDLFPYDWRRPVSEVGADLAARLRDEGQEVHLVCHSFGALLARAAAVAGAPNMGKVVMLGPCNQGLFAMAQALRGSHWALHFVAAVDGTRRAFDLAAGAISTWRSIPEGLPVKLRPDDLDLFDLDQWPTEGLRPRPALLAAAAELRRSIAEPAGTLAEGRCFVIAGHGHPTVTRVERDGGAFRYHTESNGDGFVPTERAALADHPVYYVRAAHIGLPYHLPVIEAVRDLLERGDTDRLDRTPPSMAAPPPASSFTDADPIEPPFGGRRGGEITSADVHALFDEVLGFVVPA
jgi:pimeloyl-ACP methyl ester carboxylesterase